MRHGALLAAAAALAVTACGGSAAAHPAAGSSPNVQACQHFRIQGKKVAAIAAPTMADLAQAIAWVQEDESLATDPALRRDFRIWVADVRKVMNGQNVAANPKTAIAAGCARYGVKVLPTGR